MLNIARLMTSGAAVVLAVTTLYSPAMSQPAEKREEKREEKGGPATEQKQAPSVPPTRGADQRPERSNAPPVAREPSAQRQKPTAERSERQRQNEGTNRAQSNEGTTRQPNERNRDLSREKPAAQRKDTRRDDGGTSAQRPAQQEKREQGRGDNASKPEERSRSGQARARPTGLNEEQRTHARQVFKDQRPQRVSRVNVNISIGSRVPRTTRLSVLPPTLVTVVPAYRNYRYVYADNRIVIVDPVTYEIVEIVDNVVVGSSGTTTAALELTLAERRLILDNVDAAERGEKIRMALALGAELPSSVVLHRFAPVIINNVPKLRPYRHLVVDNDVLIVDPKDREIALIIRRHEK